MRFCIMLPMLALALPVFSQAPAPKKPNGTSTQTTEGPDTEGPPVAAVSSIQPEDLEGFEHYAPQIQALIRKSLELTQQNLTYTFGSADPKQGGMDCSGTIYFVLHDFGFKGVPRQSNEMAEWVRDKTLLHRVETADSLSHPEFSSLQPGYLLFWSGTYDAGTSRVTPVTHVMLYLGKLKKDGRHVVFGASDGRAYQGKRRTGVSVFDFSLPKSTSAAKFYGYGMIPGVGRIKPPMSNSPVVTTLEKSTGSAPLVKETPPASAATAKTQESSSEKSVTRAPNAPDKTAGADVLPEEIRPAIVAARKEETAAAKSSSKPTSPKTTASKPKSSPSPTPKKSHSSPSGTVTKRKSAPAPTPLERAKRAAGVLLDDVKKTLPSGR